MSNGETGLFEQPEKIYSIDIGGGKTIKYKSAFELGHIVAFNGVDLENPYDPMNTEYDSFFCGYHAGLEKRNSELETAKGGAA